MLPLLGKRVLITRAREQSDSLRTLLEAQGAEVIAIPTIEIVPPDSFESLDAALRSISQYDWLVLTSVNAVRAMSVRAKALTVPLRDLSSVSVAAIGRATVNAVTALGLPVALIPPQAVAESLADVLSSQVRDKRVLLVRAKVAGDVLPQVLRDSGAIVTIAEAYQTIMPPQSEEAVRSAFSQHIDAVIFTSASSVQNFYRLAVAVHLEISTVLRNISIGPVTTQAIHVLGWQVAAEAEQADMHAITAAVIHACID